MRLILRVSPQELALLDRLRGARSRSEYARRVLLVGAHLAANQGVSLAVVSDEPSGAAVPDEADIVAAAQVPAHRHKAGEVVAEKRVRGRVLRQFRCQTDGCVWTSSFR